MTTTHVDIQRRPYSVEPITNFMLPDGIFDNAIYEQVTNISGTALNNVDIYFESVSDPGIVVLPKTWRFVVIPAGATVTVWWDSNFQLASPGKPIISVICKAQGLTLRRLLRKIFVSQTRYDSNTKEFTCTVPEGNMRLTFQKVITTKDQGKDCDCNDRDDGSVLFLPTKLSAGVGPNPPYTGQLGDLPFEDPWWKILALIVAAIAAIVGAIAAAAGSGAFQVGAKGTFEETDPSIKCCKPDPKGVAKDTKLKGVAGVASVVTTGALAVALSDAKDPWRRGQENTPVDPDEVTLSETLEAEIEYIDPPNPGSIYSVGVKWLYTRITDRRTLTYTVSEINKSEHLLHKLDVSVPTKIVNFKPSFDIQVRFEKKPGELYAGPDLYVFAIVTSPQRNGFLVPLYDDGINIDRKANDGVYSGQFDLVSVISTLEEIEPDPSGYWRVYVFAQDVNGANSTMLPEVAATYIGGMGIASAIKINFDTTAPCPLLADAVVEVIA
jgi:hypothetical protein